MGNVSMETIEFDGIPKGVTLRIGDIIVIGTGPIQEEKESA
jgi:hypothetical protein